MRKPHRQDLAKFGDQFVLVYQAEPTIVMPIIIKPANAPGHRTDVPINEAELFCVRKPSGTLCVKLQQAKAVAADRLSIIGKVSKASMNRIETALQRERQIQADEQTHLHRRRYR